jgi:hypothetical protein
MAKQGWSAEREFFRLMIVAGITLLIGLVGSALAVLPYAFARSFGLVLVTIVAGGTGGAAIGFLFGIPRVLTDANVGALATAADAGGVPSNGQGEESDGNDSNEVPTGRRLLASNSNLEQVSDWLTKIILGLGLTQLYKLNDFLLGFEDLVRSYVPPADRLTPLIATIMLIFAVLCGFLSMYLETRLVLSRIFNTVEAILANILRQKKEITVQKEEAEARARSLEDVVTNIAGDPSSSPVTLAAAADSLKSLVQSARAGSDLRSVAAQALAASGRTSEASELITSGDAATTRDQIAAMQVALYKNPPEGFEEVLSIAANLSSSDEARRSADYWFFQACAFGQQHHFLKEHGGTEEQLESARDNALDAARRCLAVDSSYRIRLLWLLYPDQSPIPTDDDLADFADDPDFRELVKPLQDPVAEAGKS